MNRMICTLHPSSHSASSSSLWTSGKLSPASYADQNARKSNYSIPGVNFTCSSQLQLQVVAGRRGMSWEYMTSNPVLKLYMWTIIFTGRAGARKYRPVRCFCPVDYVVI